MVLLIHVLSSVSLARRLPPPPFTTITSTITPTSTTTSGTTSAPSSISTSTTDLNIRLLPLGDSITFGFTSSDGNGYRSTLHNLFQTGNTVDFIGSLKSGTMADNDNEDTQVVLLMAGTNDVIHGISSGTPTQLSTLIDSIFTTCPDAALIVATLTPLSSGQAAVTTYNHTVTQLVNTRKPAGKHILLASMASVLASDLKDGVHPTDAGCVTMANAWFPVIQQAATNGWIGKPV
ncbi:SGNH hydrolase-type esterase domain-containing protein [Mycena vulgaris]|nr:SGNH hydrolase-type esterase domain-containing protein [Mycena vulgaris]